MPANMWKTRNKYYCFPHFLNNFSIMRQMTLPCLPPNLRLRSEIECINESIFGSIVGIEENFGRIIKNLPYNLQHLTYLLANNNMNGANT